MVDSYHPFWWWCGCIMYLLLRECLFHMSFSVKMIHRHVAYLRTSSVKLRGKAKFLFLFLFFTQTVPWPMGCALNSTHVIYVKPFVLSRFLVAASANPLARVVLVSRFKYVAFSQKQPNTILEKKKKWVKKKSRSSERFRATTGHRFATWVLCGCRLDLK